MNPNMSTPTHPPVTPTNDRLREEVREYVQRLRVFQVHTAVFAAGMVVIFLANLFTNIPAGIPGQWSAWWSLWAFIGWGLAITVHGLLVRLSRPTNPSTTREDQQINKTLASLHPDTTH